MEVITKATPSLSVDVFTFDLQRFDGEVSTWDGTVGTVPDAVEGVITITTAEQLAAVAAAVNGGNDYNGVTIKLGADLDLNGHNWTPIGNDYHRFKGTFDGDNHTISNLTISGGNYVGLFGVVESGTVQNVTLTNTTVNGDYFVGGLVGENYGEVSGNTVFSEVSGNEDVGGLVGFNSGGGGTVSGNYYYSNKDAVGGGSGIAENNTRYYKLTVPEGVTAEFTGGDDYKVTINGTTYYKSGAPFKLTVTDFPNGQYLKGATADDGNYTYTMSNTALEWAEIPTIEGLTFDRSINAFKISTADELQALATYANAGNDASGWTFKLTDDIDLSSVSNFTPIGTYDTTDWIPVPFSGTFDGGGHTIINLTISGGDYVGLFGYVGQGGTVKNVALTDVNVSGNSYVGGLVGVNDGKVSNCMVTNATASGTGSLGGLVGENYDTVTDSTVENVSVTATGDNTWVGGLVGYSNYGTISGNTVSGVTVTTTSSEGIEGGLVGYNNGYGTVTDNTVDAKITVGAGSWVGGLTGDNCGGTITGNIVVSEITAGDNSYVGSVVAYEEDNSSSVKNNFFHSTANDVVGYFDYSGGNENITDNNPLYVVTLQGVTASGDTCFTVDGTAYAAGTVTLAAKTGYVYSGDTTINVTEDKTITASLDTANHYVLADDTKTLATADNTTAYPDLVQVYELTVPDSLTVSGDIVATADGKTYAAGEVTLTAAKGYTIQSISVDGSTLDGTTFTVDAATEISAESFKSINGGKGVEVGGTTGDFSAESGVYSVTASQQNSTLTGNNNNNNVVIAGGGENILTGGGGNDTYTFSAGGGIVTDYGIGSTKDSTGKALSAPSGSDIIKIDGTVSGVYFDRDASSKKDATFTAIVTYGTGDDTQIIVLQNINKKPTKYSSDPSKAVYQTNDAAAATLKIWDMSGSKQAVLSASKLKALFHDDSDLSELVQSKVTYLGEIAKGETPTTNPFEQTAQATFNGNDNG